jgi:hypothetical protein
MLEVGSSAKASRRERSWNTNFSVVPRVPQRNAAKGTARSFILNSKVGARADIADSRRYFAV